MIVEDVEFFIGSDEMSTSERRLRLSILEKRVTEVWLRWVGGCIGQRMLRKG